MSAVETAPRVPTKGSKLRRLYDILMLGHPVSTERAVLIFGTNASAQGALRQLREFYGLNIKNVSRGMWRYFPEGAA